MYISLGGPELYCRSFDTVTACPTSSTAQFYHEQKVDLVNKLLSSSDLDANKNHFQM